MAHVESRVAVVPMGVDLASLAATEVDGAALKVEQRLDGKRVIAFIGRLVEKKGVAFLLEALSQIVRDSTNRDLVLLVAGDGPLRDALVSQVQRLGLHDHVRFLGYVRDSGSSNCSWLADVVAVPSIETAAGDSEGFPVVVMEALAASKVCVATDATHAESIVTGRHQRLPRSAAGRHVRLQQRSSARSRSPARSDGSDPDRPVGSSGPRLARDSRGSTTRSCSSLFEPSDVGS